MKNPKRPRDSNQLAKSIVGLATGEIGELASIGISNIHAIELGRLGGLKGGKARAESLSAEKRSEIARIAANKRWKKN